MNFMPAFLLLTLVSSTHQDRLNDALLRAASLGDTGKVAALLNQGAKINTRTLLQQTPLELAVEYKHEAAVRYLLQRGAAINVSSTVGTPLTWAAIDGDVAATDMLLTHGAMADYHSQGLNSLTPLATVLFASLSEKTQTTGAVRLMRIYISPPNPHNKMLVKLIQEKEAEQGARQFVGMQPEALKKRQSQNLQVVYSLVAHGANVNRKGGGGSTPLINAALAGNTDAAKLLVEHGSIIDAKDDQGMTALYEAAGSGAMSGKADLVEFLLKHGANPNIQSKSGMTALFRAVEGQSLKIVKILLAHGADPKLTPLAYGINRNLPPQPGETILARAKEFGNPKIIEVLENAGAK